MSASNNPNPPYYTSQCPNGHNGPTGTGSQASGTRGGHKDNTGNTSSRGGRPSGGGFGHHSGSTQERKK
ncbi:uncharacterized protein CTRU02_210528 [Colletotrichum truncatum]|uniref:Uncharacterized protein n=1 Tax=Colletotrichum truncatum TaxID=5467 RepID=A0ACC3YP87_COLTU|nr:uncharacterized protein CTRU02_12728 [Colletotrichum truncatum]KAF6784199.1 hypothetical protein CTRU02_12728 [Colletotrichum truncatum]